MRKMILTALVALTASVALAQPTMVLNAYNYWKENELIKAKENIEPATTHIKTAEDAKTWYYRAMIYESIYLNSFVKNEKSDELLFPELTAHRNGAVRIAVESYEKALSIPSNKINMNDVKDRYLKISAACYQEGVNLYNEKDYAGAAWHFGKCYEIKKASGIDDFEAAYNAGLSYNKAGDQASTEKYLRECIEHDYAKADSYLTLLQMYSAAGDQAKYQEVLREARTAMPENQDLIREEINIYLANKDYDKALNNLNIAIEADQNSAQLFFARGNILDSKFNDQYKNGDKTGALETFAKAEADYKKAVELDATYFDAVYSLGALYFNYGATLLNEANDILDDKLYKATKDRAESQLKAAMPHLEAAHKIDPTDRGTMESLKVIYIRMSLMDKANEMTEKLKN